MGSIVLDLQQEIISQDCDIVNVLRKAHMIAVKLGLEEFDKWICNELNGYQSANDCPNYRKIHCQLIAENYYGWKHIVINDFETEENLTEKIIRISISEIMTLLKTYPYHLTIPCSDEELDIFNKMFDVQSPTIFTFQVTSSSAKNIVEKVKNTLLEWTLQLEKEGIVGDNITFGENEKKQAKSIPQFINNYYGNTNVINDAANKSSIVAGNNNTISITKEELYSKLSDIADEIQKTNEISSDDISKALKMLSDIQDKVTSNKKTGVIKSSLLGLKDFLITAGGGIVANMLATLITRL